MRKRGGQCLRCVLEHGRAVPDRDPPRLEACERGADAKESGQGMDAEAVALAGEEEAGTCRASRRRRGACGLRPRGPPRASRGGRSPGAPRRRRSGYRAPRAPAAAAGRREGARRLPLHRADADREASQRRAPGHARPAPRRARARRPDPPRASLPRARLPQTPAGSPQPDRRSTRTTRHRRARSGSEARLTRPIR